MRTAFAAALVIGLVAGGVLSAYRVATRSSGAPAVADATSGPSATATPSSGTSPRTTAEAFARAWSDGDIDALHRLLSRESQVRYPPSEFAAEYLDFETETTARTLEASVASVEGSAARLTVHLDTGYFGAFDYTTTLNLVREGERWAVSWDRVAIHPDLSGLRSFRSDIQRPGRGSILDRNGVVLSETVELRMLGLNRSLVADQATLRAALVAFGFPAADIDAAFASSLGQDQRVPVGPVADERAEEALALPGQFPGVLIYAEARRVHPLGAAAAHVVGYTRELNAEEVAAGRAEGARPGDRTGASGLEAGLDDRLSGLPGAELILVGPDGATVRVIASQPFQPAEDVTTTLDAAVLQATYQRLGERPGAAVVLDPRTNSILALNSSPSFDPDAFERGDSAAIAAINASTDAPLLNRATFGLYSAGSTFKLITGAAGLISGIFSPSSTIFCGATWEGIDPPRRNWEGAQGPLTIAGGLMRSCNPVFYEIAYQLYQSGTGLLSKTARDFGFGAPTGVVGLFEEAGLVPDAEWKQEVRGETWFPGDEVNLGIGQGDLLVTPLQLANAYSSFVARELRTPVIMSGLTAEALGPIPLSDAGFALLAEGLRLVAGPNGTANSVFWNAGYTNFAGKSGTAEDAGLQQHVLFVAMSPASAPAAIAAVVLDGGESGSLEAGPIARDLVLSALSR